MNASNTVERRTAARLYALSELAEGGKFRSLTDVDKYLALVTEKMSNLDGLLRQYQMQFARVGESAASLEFVITDDVPSKGKGTTTKVPKLDRSIDIKVPRVDLLKKNFGVVSELSEQVEGLDALYNSVQVQFRTIRGSVETLNSIKKLRATAQLKLEKALAFLQNVGTKHIPSPFQDFVNATTELVTPALQFKSSEFSVYAYENKDEQLAFSVYIKLKGLSTNDDSFYPAFYLVYTAALIPQGKQVLPEYRVTVLHDFATPEKFRPGKVVSSPDEASRALGVMLELENVNSAIGVVPHNIDPKLSVSKFTVNKFIKKLSVEPDNLEFLLLPGLSTKVVNEVAQTLYQEVKSLITSVKKAQLKVRIFKDAAPRGSKTAEAYVVRYTLTNLARDDQISVDDLDFLKDQFSLDDTRLRQVVKIINS